MRRFDTGSTLESAHDSWRMWLLTGTRREPVDRRRIRGSHLGLKRMLLEGMRVPMGRPYSWKEFSDAMVRQSVGEAMHSMRQEDSRLVKLAYFGGLSNREIAGNMGLGEATVERRLRHALDVIQGFIERGRSAGQRVITVIAVWLTGRWLSDAMQSVAPIGAVAAATVIILAGPAPAVAGGSHAPAQAPSVTTSVVPPIPSPTAPVTQPEAGGGSVAAPPVSAGVSVQTPMPLAPVQLPQVQIPPVPPAPPPPALPVKVKPPTI